MPIPTCVALLIGAGAVHRDRLVKKLTAEQEAGSRAEMEAVCPGGWPDAYLHLLSPFAIQFTENFGLRWYGLSYLTGFYLGYLAILWLSTRQRISLAASLVSDFVFTAALGVVVGGRLGYCILYQPSNLIEFTSEAPFWKLLAINEGGMASHGGIAGMMLAVLWFARKHNLNVLELFDLTCIGGPIGIFFGRLANFVNGELWGRIAPECYRWAVKFPGELGGATGIDSRLNEFGASLGNHALIKAAQLGNPEAIAALQEALPGRYPSQLFEAFLEGFLPLVIILWLWRMPRKPGVIAATFLFIYPIARFLGENYRMPDAHLGFQALGLTRGQWLSIAMLVISAVLVHRWRRSTAKPHGGWRV